MTLIEKLTYEILYAESLPWSMGDYIDGLQKAIKIVENHSNMKYENWIPVSERLPQENDEYQITIKDGRGYTVHQDYFKNGIWTSYGHYVVAWRPLSEPYKGE